jgi:histidine ammonia-lyase
LGRRILAVGLMISAQALDLREPVRLGALTGPARALVRGRVAFAGPGDPYPSDLEPLVELVASGTLAHARPPGAVPG